MSFFDDKNATGCECNSLSTARHEALFVCTIVKSSLIGFGRNLCLSCGSLPRGSTPGTHGGLRPARWTRAGWRRSWRRAASWSLSRGSFTTACSSRRDCGMRREGGGTIWWILLDCVQTEGESDSHQISSLFIASFPVRCGSFQTGPHYWPIWQVPVATTSKGRRCLV